MRILSWGLGSIAPACLLIATVATAQRTPLDQPLTNEGYELIAERMGVTRMRVSEIVRGKRAISAESAILLGQALGTSARFWMNLQTTHDLAVAALKLEQVA